MKLTLKQLEVFVQVTKLETVSHAAQSLFITQAAASMALAETEKLLGFKLFDRQGRKLILNENGRELLPKAIEVLEKVNEIEHQFSESPNKLSIHLGASSTIGNYFLANLIGRFQNEFPNIQPSLSISNTEKVLNQIENFELDLGFVEGYEIRPKLNFHKWRHDRLVIICSPNHPLANKDKITKKDLQTTDWILREKGSGSRSVFEAAIKGKLTNLNIILELENSEAIKQVITSGVGISCVSLLAVKKMLWNQEIVALRAPFLNLHRDLFMVTIKNKQFSNSMLSAIDFWARFSLIR